MFTNQKIKNQPQFLKMYWIVLTNYNKKNREKTFWAKITNESYMSKRIKKLFYVLNARIKIKNYRFSMNKIAYLQPETKVF